MDITDDVRTPLRNLWSLTFGRFGSGLPQHEPTQSTVLFDEPHRELRRYGDVQPGSKPILLVPPLAAPASCYDFHTNQSLVEFLADCGYTPYVVDYGRIAFEDRRLGFEDFVDSIVPQAISRVLEDSGANSLNLFGWSLGGTISLLTAAAHPTLPIATVTAIATPLNYSKYHGTETFRFLHKLTGGVVVSNAIRALGNIHAPIVQAGFRLSALDREVTKPWFMLKNLGDTETLARMRAIDRFTGDMPAYPGRLYNQIWNRLMVENDLAKGRLKLGKRTIDLTELKVPTLSVGSPDDVIAPLGAVKHGVKVLTGATPLRFEVAPGSHLGVLTGPSARTTTWAFLKDFLAEFGR